MGKRSREIMVVKVLDVQYGRPGAIVRLQRTLGTQPELVPRVFYTALCPRQKLAVVTLDLFSKSPVGEIALGCGSGF